MKNSKYQEENEKLKQDIKKLKTAIREINDELSHEIPSPRKISLKLKSKISQYPKSILKRTQSEAQPQTNKLNLASFPILNIPEFKPFKTDETLNTEFSQRSKRKIMFIDSPKLHSTSSQDLTGNKTESLISFNDSLTETVKISAIPNPRTKTYPVSILKSSKVAEVNPPNISPNESYLFAELSLLRQENSDLRKRLSKNRENKPKTFSNKLVTKKHQKSARQVK